MANKKRSSFPKPHANISIKKRTIDAGTHLFRIHPSIYGGVTFNNSSNGNARFSPITNRATKKIIPTIYAGDLTEVAICEVVFHDIDLSQDQIIFEQKNLHDKNHTELEIIDNLVVAVIDHTSVIKMRAGKKLIHCDPTEYKTTRMWAEYIHDQHNDVQGLEWPSRQYEGKAYVFFEDRIKNTTLSISKSTTVLADREVVEKFLDIADQMNITIE